MIELLLILNSIKNTELKNIVFRLIGFNIFLSISVLIYFFFFINAKTLQRKLAAFSFILNPILFAWGDCIFLYLTGITLKINFFQNICIFLYFFLFALANLIAPEIESKKIYYEMIFLSNKYIEFFLICSACLLSTNYNIFFYLLAIWIFFYTYRKESFKESDFKNKYLKEYPLSYFYTCKKCDSRKYINSGRINLIIARKKQLQFYNLKYKTEINELPNMFDELLNFIQPSLFLKKITIPIQYLWKKILNLNK